jgi:hypothetical protein
MSVGNDVLLRLRCRGKAESILNIKEGITDTQCTRLTDLIFDQLKNGYNYSLEAIGDYLNDVKIGFSVNEVIVAFDTLHEFYNNFLPEYEGCPKTKS